MRHAIVGLSVLALLLGCAATASADDNWMLRTRLIYIAPDDGADGILEGADTTVESDLTVEVDLSYFFGDRWAIEGILATAAQEVKADLGGGEVSLGSVYHAPATILGQYHFGPDNKVKPYVGLGINYTIFYRESGTLDMLDLDSGSFGVAGQFGIDFRCGENKYFNFDVKYANIETDVEDPTGVVAMGSLGTVEVNPWIIGAGFGLRF